VVLCPPNRHSCCHGIRHGDTGRRSVTTGMTMGLESMKYHFRLMDAWEDKAGDRKIMGLPTALVV
ncbi:hypothetical protein AVEN_157262-1, partial [Araneus ventricosus]